MRKFFHCVTVGFFLLSVGAEKEDFQGFQTKQTKGTPVTEDLLLRKENAIGHSTEAIPQENSHQHTAVAETAKFPGAVLFDTRPMPPHETTQNTRAVKVASPGGERFVFRNGQNYPTLLRDNPSTRRIHTGSEEPFLSYNENIVFSSTQPAFESMINGTFEPKVQWSANAVKASPWLPTLLDNRKQKNTDSVTLTFTERGPSVLILSAYPLVIDNLAAPHNDNDDKRSQGEDEKGISNLGKNEYPFDMTQSVFQGDTGEDLLRGSTGTNLCLTCQKDRKAASTEKSVTLPALSPHVSSNSSSTHGLALDFNQFTALLHSLNQQPAGEQEDIVGKEISHKNTSKHSSFSGGEQLIHSLTFPPLSFNKTVNQSITNGSQIKYSLSDISTAAVQTKSLAEVLSVTQIDTRKQSRQSHLSESSVTERPVSALTARYSSSLLRSTLEKPLKSRTKINRDPGLRDRNETTLKYVTLSRLPVITQAPDSGKRKVPAEGNDHSRASHLTARMRLKDAHGGMTTIKNPEPHMLTGEADSVFSLSHSRTPDKPSSPTTKPILTLLLKSSSNMLVSPSTKRQLTDELDSFTLNTVKGSVTKPFADLSGSAPKNQQTPTLTSREVVTPGKFLLWETRQNFYNSMFVSTLTTAPSKTFSERPAAGRLLGEVSKNHVESTRPSVMTSNRNSISDPLVVHNPEGAGDKDEEITEMWVEESKGTRETPVLKLQGEEMTEENEKLENKREALFLPDKMEDRDQEKIITSRVEITQNTDKAEDKTEKHEVKINRGKGNIGKESVTLWQNKVLRHWEVRDKESAERESVTDISTQTFNKDVKKEREALTTDVNSFNHISETGREDRTDGPCGPDTDSEEVNSDKGQPVSSLSSCHSLIKQFEASEHRVIHNAQMKKKPFSKQMTSHYIQFHPTLRSQSTKISDMTAFPKEPFAEIKPHPFTHRAELTNHASVSSLTLESIFSVTATSKPLLAVSTSTFPPHSSTHKSAPPVPHSISNMLSINVSPSGLTSNPLPAQPHVLVNTSTLGLSIIQSILHHRQKFSTSGLNINSLLQTTDERERAEQITQATIYKSGVKGSLTFRMIEGVNTSTLVTPLLRQMQDDSSARTITAATLTSEALGNTGHLQSHQGQSVAQIPQSSSFEVITGQPCFCKLSKQKAHLDTWHDGNEQKSIQAQMSSMSPKTRNDPFPFSSNSSAPPLNLMLLRNDSLPCTLSMIKLTKSSSGSETEDGNSRGDNSESLSEAAEETKQADEVVTMPVKHLDAVTKQMIENTDKKDGFPFPAQPTGLSKHHRSNSEKSDSWSTKTTERLAVIQTSEYNHDDLLRVVKASLEDNHFLKFDSYNETRAVPLTLDNQTTLSIEQALNEDFEPVTSDSTTSVGGTNDPTDNAGNSVPEIPITRANDVSNSTILDRQRPAEKNIGKQHYPSTPQDPLADEAYHTPHIQFGTDLKIPVIPTQLIADQMMTVTSEFKIAPTKTSDLVSLSKSGIILSQKAHESGITTVERVPVVSEKTSEAGQAERMLQPDNHTEPETTASDKFTPTVKRNNTTETRNVEQLEREISIQDIEQNQRALLGMTAITSPINNPQWGIQAFDGAGGAAAVVQKMNNFSFKDLTSAMMVKSVLKAQPHPHENPPVDRKDQNKEHTSPSKTSMSGMIPGVLTDSVPPTGIVPTEMNDKNRCKTVGCAKTGETTTETGVTAHTAGGKMFQMQAAYTGRDHFSASETRLENPKCSTNCPVPGEATPQADIVVHSSLSSASTKPDHDSTSADETKTHNVNSMSYETSPKTWGVTVDSDHLEGQGILEQAEFAEKTTQRHSHGETSETAEVTSSGPEATVVKAIEQILPSGKNTIRQSNRGAGAEVSETQTATRSSHSLSKGEMVFTESEHRMFLPQPASESEGQRRKQERSSHRAHLSGVTEVSDDLCGTGNYTAEMSLNLGRDLQPGDTLPALGDLTVVISLKTNNSRLNLEVTSCCLSPTIQADLTNSTCCLFSRLAAQPAGITLLPTGLPTSASFTISLFQMINYSVVYLHCDLSVCPRNHSDCERCLQQRRVFPFKAPRAVVTNLRNRISFGPMLKEAKNSTFLEERDPSELDLALVIVSLVVGTSVVTVMLLLVWLAYRHRSIRSLQSAAPSQTCCCCCCLQSGGDLILP